MKPISNIVCLIQIECLTIRRPPLEGPPGCGATVRNPSIWYPAFLSILLALELSILYILSLISILLHAVCSVVLTHADSPFTFHFRGSVLSGPHPPGSGIHSNSEDSPILHIFTKSDPKVSKTIPKSVQKHAEHHRNQQNFQT